MDIKKAIYAQLSGDATLAALVGTRIYADYNGERSVFPYITFYGVSGSAEETMGGATDLMHAVLQLDVWALKSTDVSTIMKSIRRLLDNKYGTWGGVVVDLVILNNFLYTYQFPSDGSEGCIYKGSVEVASSFRETD